MDNQIYTDEDKKNELRIVFNSLPLPITEELYEECLMKLDVEFSERILQSIMYPTSKWLYEVGGKEFEDFQNIEVEYFTGSILRKVREERLVMEKWKEFE